VRGDQEKVPVPDDLDGVWREPGGADDGGDRWLAATATAGEYGPVERAYDWGQCVLAGTRDCLRFAIARRREHGHAGLAADLEREPWPRPTGR